MRSEPTYAALLKSADRPTSDAEQHLLQTESGFPYHMVMGELIFAMVIVRADHSFSITKLSQYNASPAKCNYQAVKHVFAYLLATRTEGLTYWRSEPRLDLPDLPPPKTISDPCHRLQQPDTNPTGLTGYTDSNLGSDRSHCRSISGVIILLAAAAILYKTKFQKAVALSSTEAEFVSASDGGKMLLYLRSLLKDLDFEQPNPTHMNQDNHGTIHMANAQARPVVVVTLTFATLPSFNGLKTAMSSSSLSLLTSTSQIPSPKLLAASSSTSMRISTAWAESHRHMLLTAVLFVSPESPLFLPHMITQSLPCLTMIDAVYSMGRCSDTVLQ
jgi:hypothetical protein